MKTLLRALLAAMVLALSLPLLSPTQAKAETFRYEQIDPQLQALLRRMARLRAQGVIETVTLGVSTSDCPADCNDSVRGGMCYCGRNDEGGCDDGRDETTLGGRPACRVRPETAELRGEGIERQVLQIQRMP
ncbi:hypothetical protein [Pararhodobacter sp. CCB-MM2]|uniref:hypothetical protein n=1 Tax=Pararhodobacter sp. CCB-MM2 TaxID=1786003 RepID=UPI0008328341|nr:hypothetical protein [Pararhodobacter sp. CCB-MM2]